MVHPLTSKQWAISTTGSAYLIPLRCLEAKAISPVIRNVSRGATLYVPRFQLVEILVLDSYFVQSTRGIPWVYLQYDDKDIQSDLILCTYVKSKIQKKASFPLGTFIHRNASFQIIVSIFAEISLLLHCWLKDTGFPKGTPSSRRSRSV
jgi:hypothetical protein